MDELADRFLDQIVNVLMRGNAILYLALKNSKELMEGLVIDSQGSTSHELIYLSFRCSIAWVLDFRKSNPRELWQSDLRIKGHA